VIDVACGSGDAQTLCLTEDDTAWSWGDGDYGKLGKKFKTKLFQKGAVVKRLVLPSHF
jgi:alpha-tubulin suppressor-like RCC1 family protein